MRMLLRASTYRFDERSGETEIAAAPDTPGRERWTWELRLLETGKTDAPENIALVRVDGSAATLVLRGDPDLVEFSLRLEPVDGVIERVPGEMTILVAVGGSVVISGIHPLGELGELGELDALVVEGDEPGHVAASSVKSGTDVAGRLGDAPGAVLVVARVVSTTLEQLRWVP